MTIGERVKKILGELPDGVELVAATKKRTQEEILQAVEAGIRIVGENYVQEAEGKLAAIEGKKTVEWHMIGHLQRNKAEKAIDIFDTVQTLDNIKLARQIDKAASKRGVIYPVFLEINSAKETAKTGAMPEDAEKIAREISCLDNIKISGLMTMGPFLENPEDMRPYFRLAREIFEHIKSIGSVGTNMKHLSMGMSGNWQIALEEGANMLRIGSEIFGPREG